jgi:hypothetical protein
MTDEEIQSARADKSVPEVYTAYEEEEWETVPLSAAFLTFKFPTLPVTVKAPT